MLRLPDAAPAARKGARLPAAVGLTLCLLWATSWAEAAGPTYLLAALKSIRPGANLTIGVAMLKKSPQKVTVKAEVVYANNTVLRGEAVFKRDSVGTLVLPALPLGSTPGDYDLLVKGYSEGRLLFSNHTALEFEHKSLSVFIQTDKTMYKPGQDVKIRVVTLYPDLKPYNTPMNIYIHDPRHNLIQQWLSQNGKLGKIAKQFKISKYPVLGDWSIKVQVKDQTHYQTFTVMEYVLPKFEVFLATPLFYSQKDMNFTGTVTAKYTYGKPVQGKVTVDCSRFYGRKKNITKTFEINGSVNFTFDILEVENITYNNWGYSAHHQMPVEITAVVTEALTGISQNASATVFPKHHDYILEFSEYPAVLKPSLNFIATLKVTKIDNSLLSSDERRNDIVITATSIGNPAYYPYGDGGESQANEASQNLIYHVPENGIIEIEFPVQVNTTTLHVKAKFLESETSIIIYGTFYSTTMTFLQIKKASQDVKVGTPFELNLQSNKPMKEISYMVVSKEQIVAAGKVNVAEFFLTPEHSWAPTACIIAYYVSDDGEVISDDLCIPVQLVFKNQINMYWNKNRAGPSEEVTLKINVTEPKTTIGLLVVDKSTKLLGKRSDITEDAVHHELSLYNRGLDYGAARSSYGVFQNCKLWVSTDASLPEDENYEGFMDYSSALDFQHHLEPARESVGFENPHIRTNFPETWIWREITTRSTETTLNVTVPDTITTWVASAFIISENLGLGVMKTPIELEVFQPFFVSLNLPPSVTRGEEIVLEVNLFNYLKEGTEVTVTLDTSDTFEILIVSNDINAMGNQRSVWVPSEAAKTVIFPIKPKQIGEIPIRVTAISPIASDALLQKVLVKAEGLEQSHSETILLDLSKRIGFETKRLNFTFPSDVVPGSERVQVTVIGDILGPSISGLESLIKMPYGCGEQNMINFAPNIYVLDYLAKAGDLKPRLKSKAMSYMREGYQRELLYQRDDGSFSAFGNKDNSGSTWLSAFVLRSFIQAQPFIDIDSSILETTAAWIVRHQKHNGEFQEPGRVLHTELQGGTNSSVSLTAYIMTALLEYQTDKYDYAIRKALDFLEFKLSEGISDNHTLALVTYALSLAKSAEAKRALDLLNERSEHQEELRFWISQASQLSDSWQPQSVDIEVAGYAVLSHAKQQRLLEGIPIMKWLSQQRNHLGGYSSTQDTIVALQALSACAMLTTGIETEMDVTVSPSSENDPVVFRINNENRLLLKTKEVAATQPVGVTVFASGRGLGLFQLNIMYNVKNSHTSRRRRSAQSQEAFDLDVVVKDDKKDINHLTLNVCTRYLGVGSSSRSGMALIEVGLLSGFSLSPSFVSLDDPVKKVEKAEGKVHLYLDSLNETQVCVDIPAVRDFKVANTQDASVTVVDYYEPRRRAVRSYNSEVMQSLSPCTFCEKDECDLCSADGSSLIYLSCELLIVHVSLLYSWLL
ncbi:CD109 antigen isoform X1 [Podarcis raffonei]|uniref:CD109 antigen isoform X1 n=1 Tax=Podarcis raffonei TaxID=65483 RepID=UPI00232975A7|nr:CD109 antigen isoform X1 [Podarcis raffonei]